MSKSRGSSIPLRMTQAHRRLLCATAITPDHPGPILRDFQTLLDFIGPNGVPAGGKHRLLPLNILPTLNQHMTWPLKVDMGRPILKSYPNLQGLYLLCRATGLIIVQGEGSKAKLVVDPIALTRWSSLNPAEQYFSLLDAWLNHARKGILGERQRTYEDSFANYVIQVWGRIPVESQFSAQKGQSARDTYCYSDPDRYTLALAWLFGWVDIDQTDPIPQRTWLPASIRQRPFGEAMLAALVPTTSVYGSRHRSTKDPATDDTSTRPSSGDRHLHFNYYHSTFAPHFPSLQSSLAIDLGQPSDGLFIFRVSLETGRMWRRIAAPAQSTLDDLADAIVKSVEFSQDHLWKFTFINRFGASIEVCCLDDDLTDGFFADEFEIGQLPIRPGDSMVFLFDYGDNWEFKILLEKIDPPAPRQKLPKVIEKHGQSPEQYPNWDE